MKNKLIRIAKYSIYLFVGALFAIPMIFLVMYLKQKGKKIVFYPDFKIVPDVQITEEEIREKEDAVQAGKKLLKNIK